MSKILEKVKKMFQHNDKEREDLPDDMTRDKYLRSLRREWRMINEEKEKQVLKARIAEYKKKKGAYWLGGEQKKKKKMGKILDDDKSFMNTKMFN